ncbi:MAG: hypothetical protein M1813_001643 [Trichoglossum hirsutum]|nr:MAG: hypothetical protein M1813_001643 [Trichoglossum hirsutum]
MTALSSTNSLRPSDQATPPNATPPQQQPPQTPPIRRTSSARSVQFSPSLTPPRQNSMSRLQQQRSSSNRGGGGEWATTTTEATREEEVMSASSADETTAIKRRESGGRGKRDYQGVVTSGFPAAATMASDRDSRVEQELKRRSRAGWFRGLVDKYGSVELDNKGSVARDHLALERTFLAWLRTSLAFASIGVAITQLFRLSTSLDDTDDGRGTGRPSPGARHLRQVGKPLGATFLAIAIVVLFLGFHRYFESQYWIMRGKFPVSRGGIAIVTVVAGLLIVVSLVVVIAVGGSAFES